MRACQLEGGERSGEFDRGRPARRRGVEPTGVHLAIAVVDRVLAETARDGVTRGLEVGEQRVERLLGAHATGCVDAQRDEALAAFFVALEGVARQVRLVRR